MKVIAINSSPRPNKQSMTEMMLGHLVEGMTEAGASVETINLREKKINSCIGCLTCWTKTPGKCVHQDDMSNEIYPKWLEADLSIYATPLYYHTMNGAMSTLRERTIPAAQPFFEKGEDGLTYHPLRHKLPGSVWLSVCGFPELSEFDALSEFLNRTKHKDVSIIAEIYRPSASMMAANFLKDITEDIIDATKKAGNEIVESLTVSKETMDRISQPLISPDKFAQVGNDFWNSCINEGVTPRVFQKKKMVPRPSSIETFMLFFPAGINKESMGDRTAVLQFLFEKEDKDACYFTIKSDKISSDKGISKNPDITICTSFELWLDIMTKKVDGQQMFIDQKYTVEGDLDLMIELFKTKEEE
jgi:putative sterol carrier protein